MDPLPARPTFKATEVPASPTPPAAPSATPPPPSPTPAPAVATPPPVPPTAPQKSYKKVFIFVIVFILFLFTSAVAAFFVASRNQNLLETPPSPTPSPTPIAEITPIPEPSVEPMMTGSPTPMAQPTATPLPSDVKTKTITSAPALDGYLASNGSANNSIDIRAGRNAYAITRGFVSFDLSSIPANANIESATLRLYQINTDGSPYTTGGSLKIDHVEYGNSLEGEDYALAPLGTGIATLTTNGNVEWKEAVITEAVRDDIANRRQRSGIRVRFTTEKVGGEAGGDYAYFESAENYSGTGNIPQLVVRYK